MSSDMGLVPGQKVSHHFFVTTSSNIDRFLRFFRWHSGQKMQQGDHWRPYHHTSNASLYTTLYTDIRKYYYLNAGINIWQGNVATRLSWADYL